jgi:hypothetical protein
MMDGYFYTVVRYVPDPVRGERVNIGVAVAGEHPEFFAARFTDVHRTARVKRLGSVDDLTFIADLAIEMADARRSYAELPLTESPSKWSLAELRRSSVEWTNAIQLSELRPVLHDDPEKLLDELYARYVAYRRPRRARARDRKWVRRKVSHVLQEALLERAPDLAAAEVVERDVTLRGRLEEHQFDYRIANGAARELIRALAVETEDRDASNKEVDALAWAIDDVRQAGEDVPIDVVGVGNERILERAQRIYDGLGAALVREDEIDEWARRVVLDMVTERD